jgi:hypothetical protein
VDGFLKTHVWRADDRLMHTTQSGQERSRNIIRSQRVRDRLFNSVLGVDNAPLGPVMGKRGGRWHADGRFFRQYDHRGGVSLRDAKPLRQGGEGAGGGIAEDTQRCEEDGEEDVNSLIRCALAHTKQTPLHHLERIGVEINEDEEQPIFRCRQGAVFIDGKLAGGPGFPIEAPHGHMRLERGLEGRDQSRKFLKGQTGEIQELCGAGLHIDEPYTGHPWGFLSWEAQYTIIGINSINRYEFGRVL